jgi:cytochrome c553
MLTGAVDADGRSLDPATDAFRRSHVARSLFIILPILLASLCQHALAQNLRTSPSGPPNTIEERLRACVSCHGQGGRGISNVYFPRLAGKPAGYLYNQLLAFREGRRNYAPMNYLLAYLPDDYLMKMAQYYANIQLPFRRRFWNTAKAWWRTAIRAGRFPPAPPATARI